MSENTTAPEQEQERSFVLPEGVELSDEEIRAILDANTVEVARQINSNPQNKAVNSLNEFLGTVVLGNPLADNPYAQLSLVELLDVLNNLHAPKDSEEFAAAVKGAKNFRRRCSGAQSRITKLIPESRNEKKEDAVVEPVQEGLEEAAKIAAAAEQVEDAPNEENNSSQE